MAYIISMRLYSRGQMVIVSVISASAAVLLLAAAFLVFASRWSASAPLEAPGADQAPAIIGEGPAAEDAAIQAVPAQGGVQPAFSADEVENISVYERLNAAVVNITTEVMGVNWFMEPVPMGSGSGSGSIIDAKGFVLTNYHVVEQAYKITITFADGSSVEGKVRGTDQENDLAVLAFEPEKGKSYATIPFGDSSKLRVGQKVLAIGNPFGLDRTLTTGIVSALGRPIQGESGLVIQGMIQTDASINPGNSGGPLLNTRGEMIGVNTMIYSPSSGWGSSGGSVGIGFSVPVDTARRVVSDLIKYGVVKRGWIDITPVQLRSDIVEYMNRNGYTTGVRQGILVSELKKGGNADRAGIRAGRDPVQYSRRSAVFYLGGDIITAVGGRPVSTISDLYSALESSKPGQELPVELYRSGKKMTVDVTLSERSTKLETSL